jgi:hypothetical protein
MPAIWYEGRGRLFEVIVRCATLLAYADGAGVVPNSTFTESSNRDRDGQSTSAQARGVVGEPDAEGGVDGDVVPWDVWGPRATTMFDHGYGYVNGRRNVLGERRAMLEQGVDQICIQDFNPYRIQQMRASMVEKGLKGQICHRWGNSREEEGVDEGEGNTGTFHPKVTCRIVKSSTIRAQQWFHEDVTTALPYLEIKVDVPSCREIFMEQDQILLRVDYLDKVSGMIHCDRLMIPTHWIAFD